MRPVARILAAAALLPSLMACAAGAGGPVKNGFDLANATVPPEEIHQGGPPRDGIPAIDDPRFIAADEARWLAPEDRVLAVVRRGEAKAYPIRILNWHEVVNDRIAERPIVVTYCPLCGSGMVFNTGEAGSGLTFGVSGLLYNSDLLLYDRQTESLWSQIQGKAIAGPRKGERLAMMPATHTTWSDWRQRHPDTRVLSRDTGYRRHYSRSPYAGYADSRSLYFPVSNRDRRYHPKEQIIGLEIDGRAKAYPFVDLARAEGQRIEDRFAGRELTIRFDAEDRTGRILDAGGDVIPTSTMYWFAWAAFHPDTAVYSPSAGGEPSGL